MQSFWKNIKALFRQPEPSGDFTLQQVGEKSAPFQALVSGGRVPALAVRVQQGGAILLRGAFGKADLSNGKAARPETRFRIASISKPITATALANMVAQGSLKLGDKVTDYVPEFPEYGIQLRHLASHTAGIRGYRGKEYALNRPMDIRDGLELFREDPLVFAPGCGYLYNSFDFVLLSLAMERAAGIPFEELVQKTVLEPLGMLHTTAEDPKQPAPGQAVAYTRTRAGFRRATPVDNRFKLAGGGYLSTIDDICCLGHAWLEGRVATAAVRETFLTAAKIDGESTWYGLGWEVSADPGGRSYFGHTGNSVGAYTLFRVYPEHKIVATVLVNAYNPKIRPELEAALDLVMDADGRG